eukprot:snap_masked-scaffold104_size368486-processed-gene-2.0 protein:Tk07553 transcript:snap_masked-scaffold104_size368486-processed-gene-2.0-mRNA-1 annotation:"large tegument protein"
MSANQCMASNRPQNPPRTPPKPPDPESAPRPPIPGATWADSQSPEVNTPASASRGGAGPMGRDSSGWKVQKGRGPAKSRKEMPNRFVWSLMA